MASPGKLAPSRTGAPWIDWPTFRGADRTAVAPDTDLLEQWPEGGPRLLWTATGAGRGYASVAIAGDKTTGVVKVTIRCDR